jgi:hypothetical protein
VEHEEALIRAFIMPAKRSRYLERLASPKARKKFIAEHLYHMADLDTRYAKQIEPGSQFVEQIHHLLTSRGAPESCYLVSTNTELDGSTIDLLSALQRTVAQFEGTFISCIPGRLAYFEGEGKNERYILER